MATDIEYALMAGRVYQSTRGIINWLPDLQSLGWTEFFPQQQPSGFEAVSFQKGNEIVISFAGTGSNVDWWANAGGFFGVTSDQLRQAADYYLQVKAANPPGTIISFTGHSLGGGLASLMAVFFGEFATTFDQAPFRGSAGVAVATTLKDYLLNQRGYSEAALLSLTNFISVAASGGIPNEGNVRDFSVQGEILSAASGLRIGTPTSLTHGAPDLLLAVSLHSQALLTAFLQSQLTAATGKALNDVTYKLTDLLGMIFDKNLYSFDTDKDKENFLERLVRHQNGVAGLTVGEIPITADAMLTRFTADLWKIAQDGGLTMHDGNSTNPDLNEVSKALTAFAMQMYYEDTANATNANKELFATENITGGIRFDIFDVSKTFQAAFDANGKIDLKDAKGYDLFFSKYLLQELAGFTVDESHQIKSWLPYLRDWYVQAGAVGMTATDTQNRGAFMLGGNGADQLTGGTAADLLVGNAGDDSLNGGAGNDILLGGADADTLKGDDGVDLLLGGSGNDTLDGGAGSDILKGGAGADTYAFTGNYGTDIITDSDGSGTIQVDGQTLGTATQAFESIYKDAATGHTFVRLNGGNSLVILKEGAANRILVNDWPTAGSLGISLQGSTPAAPAATITGDFKKKIDDHGTPDTGDDTYVMTGDNYTKDGDEANALDLISGTAGNDVIDGKGGDDALSGMAGDDYIEGGVGSDEIQGGLGKDTLNGGAGDDFIYGSSDEAINKPMDVNFIKPVNTHADPQATGFSWTAGYDDTYANGVPISYLSGPRNRLDGDQGNIIDGGAGNDFIAAGTGADYVHGGMDNDLIWGMDKDDILFGDSGNDLIYGDGNKQLDTSVIWSLPENHGNDIIDGGDGNDYLLGQGKDDIIFGGKGDDLIWGDDDEADLPVANHGNDCLFGGAGADQLIGGAGDDYLEGGIGNDTIWGDTGNDVYFFNAGDGVDTLYDEKVEGEKNIIRFGAGVDVSNIKLRLGSLLLDLGNGDAIHIGGFDQNDVFNSSSINRFEFADGTALTTTELLARGFDLDGTAGNDSIIGTNTTDRINGLGGNDQLWGMDGDDAIQGGDGDDYLDGGAGNDTLTSGKGNDMLAGGEGSDIYLFNHYEGPLDKYTGNYDVVDNYDTSTGKTDSIRLEDYVNPEGLSVYRRGDDLLLIHTDKRAQMLIKDHFNADGKHQIDQIVFKDAIWDAATIANKAIVSTQNAMTGSAGDDTFTVDHPTDTITETTNGGVDTVNSWVTATLQANIENLNLMGTFNIDGWGNALDNVIHGNSGDNELRPGNGGYDTLIGGAGDDAYYLDGPSIVTVVEAENEGVDTAWVRESYAMPDNLEIVRRVSQTYYAAVLTGNALDNVIDASRGGVTAFIDGGAGADVMIGSSSADTFYVDNIGDKVFGGVGDEVISSVSFALTNSYGANLTLMADRGDINGTGDGGNNTIRGNNGNNILNGGAGDDKLIGIWGSDILIGGLGNDTYWAGDGGNTVIDNAASDGESALDTLQIGSGSAIFQRDADDLIVSTGPDASVTVKNHFAADGSGRIDQVKFATTGTVWDSAQIAQNLTVLPQGTSNADTLAGTWASDTLHGLEGDDTISGGDGPDRLFGDAGNDTMYGSAGNDTLDGGTDSDALYGGTGDDTYVVDNALDIVTENLNEGTDLVQSGVSCTLAANVENLTLTGTSAIDATGNALDNVLAGNSAANILTGGTGNDIYVFGKGSGQDTVDSYDTTIGKIDTVQFDDTVVSSEVLVSLLGNDLVLSIKGTTDMLTIQHYMDNDGASAYAVGQIKFQDGTIWDVAAVKAMVATNHAPVLSTALPDQAVEQGSAFSYTVPASAFTDPDAGDTLSYSATLADGSALPSWLGFDAATRTFSGTPGTLGTISVRVTAKDTGDLAASDILDIAVSVNNLTLNGTSGVDTLNGGAGDDTLKGLAGNDVLNGNAGNDRLDGGTGADKMFGGTGDDTYVVSISTDVITENADEGIDTVESNVTLTLSANVENLTLTGASAIKATGNTRDNVLKGNSAANTLSGGTGADTLIGGAGNDIYVVDNILDVVTENPDEGADLVKSSVTYTLAANVENLTLTGTTAIDATGNMLDNILTGNNAVNTLTGGAGNDRLDGGTGADKMFGGTGDDTYVVNVSTDVITENANEGMDSVESSVTLTLGANVENLTLTGTRAIKATGNTLDNLLKGNSAVNSLTGAAGNDTLDGLGGADTLTGGTGNDTYLLGRGYGADTVVENDATAGNTDVAQFLAGVTADQLWFQHVGNNLEVSVIGTSDKLLIKDWYLGTANHVEQFKTTDGAMTLLDSQVENLVNAMASFAPPAAGQTTLPPAYQTSLNTVIAANWQ